MRTSLNNIKHIEDFLSAKLSPGDALLFRAKMLIDPVLRFDVYLMKVTFTLVKAYSRKQIKSEIQTTHHKLFSDPHRAAYQQNIRQLFTKS